MQAVVFRVAIGTAVLILGFAGNVSAQQWPSTSSYSDAPRYQPRRSLRYEHGMWGYQQNAPLRPTMRQNLNRGSDPRSNFYDPNYSRGSDYPSSSGTADSTAPTVYQPLRDNSPPTTQPQVFQPNFGTTGAEPTSPAPTENPLPASYSLPEGSTDPAYTDAAWGDGMRNPGPHITSYYKQGFASDGLMQSKVGNLNMRMTKCDPAIVGSQRIARVDMERSDFQYTRIIDGILLRAAEFVWRECPRAQPIYHIMKNVYDIDQIDLYLPDGSLALRASLSNHASFFGGNDFIWWVENFAAERTRQQQLAYARSTAPQMEDPYQRVGDRIFFTVKLIMTLIGLAILAAILSWLYSLREPIARWYYFHFHPHPAESMVQASIVAGAPPLDGKALAARLGELPPGSRVLRQVRLEQGERLVSLMQDASRARARELEKSARHGLEQAALASIQEAIALAAIALERAKATFAASQMLRS